MNKTTSILVLHDEPETLRVLEKTLNAAGRKVFVASNGRSGLQLAREKRPDLVLASVRLPDLGEMEVCKQIKGNSDPRDVFFILMSDGDTSAVQNGAGKGCDADVYLLAPLNPDDLPALIQGAVRVRDIMASPLNNGQHHGRKNGNPPDAIGLIHPEGRLLAVNSQAVAIFGYDCAWELLGKNAFDLAPAGEQERIKAGIASTLKAGVLRDTVFTLRRRNGVSFEAELSASVSLDAKGRPGGLVIVGRDVTGRKEAQEALRAAENRYFSIFENATEGIFLATPEGRLIVANPALARMFGYDTPQQMVSAMTDIGRQIYVQPERRTDLKRLLEEQGSIRGFEAENYRKDGSVIWVGLNAHVVRDANGSIQYFEGTIQDITQRKLAEAQVTILAHAVESTTEMIGITDLRGDFIFVNRAFQKAHGYPEAEILGRTPEMLFSPNNPPGLYTEAFEQLHLGAWRGEVLEKRKDGTEFPVFLSTSQINNASGKVIGFMMVARDITQQKRLEKEVLDISAIEQRRLGFNLHDGLAQHLTGIAYRTKSLEDSLKSVDAVQADAAHKIVDLINDAIRQTRQLAHSLDPTEVELSGLITSLKRLSVETGEVFPVKCRFDCAESQLPLAPQTSLALFRIAQEAIHNAIVRGGAEQIELELTLANGRVMLAIRDNGKGFDPSKQTGAGMGLRLMQYRAHSINATFQLTSHPGAGTVVQCSVPVALSVPKQPQLAKKE